MYVCYLPTKACTQIFNVSRNLYKGCSPTGLMYDPLVSHRQMKRMYCFAS